jgi:hypothetical protein
LLLIGKYGRIPLVKYSLVVQSSKVHDNMMKMKSWDGAITLEKEVDLFKWKQYESEVILLTVRWYLKYSLSYRDLVEIMNERGLDIAHTTIMRWVHQFGPELDKRIRPYLKPTNDSFRTDETYIKVKGQWKYWIRRSGSWKRLIKYYEKMSHVKVKR